MKSILIINAHPRAGSFCDSVSERYAQSAAKAGAKTRVLHLRDLEFDPHLRLPRAQTGENLEPGLAEAQSAIRAADHLVWVYPNWWGTYPALLAGFLDRAFVPGFAFKYQKGSPLPEKLLAGKTSRFFVTMDGPAWWYSLVMGGGGDKAMRKSTLEFCGVKVLGATHLGGLRGFSKPPFDKHLETVARVARKEVG